MLESPCGSKPLLLFTPCKAGFGSRQRRTFEGHFIWKYDYFRNSVWDLQTELLFQDQEGWVGVSLANGNNSNNAADLCGLIIIMQSWLSLIDHFEFVTYILLIYGSQLPWVDTISTLLITSFSWGKERLRVTFQVGSRAGIWPSSCPQSGLASPKHIL